MRGLQGGSWKESKKVGTYQPRKVSMWVQPESAGLRSDTPFFSFTRPAMSTDLPYAADAEVSLSYDELEVRNNASKILSTHFD